MSYFFENVVYTENDCYSMPDRQIKRRDKRHTYKALRGYSFILGVFRNDDCIGFIRRETLGYKSAKDFIERTKHHE